MVEYPKFCPHCGTPVTDQSRFCTSCGKQIIAPVAPHIPDPVPPTPPAQPPKRSPIWAYILVTSLFVYGCYALLLAPAMRLNRQSTPHDVVYRVSGTARTADLTFENANGASEQRNNQSVPWKQQFTGHGDQFLYISAQNRDASGTVKCEIVLDGVVVKSAESTGSYVIASCSGSI